MRLIDADALKEEIAVGKEHVAKHQDPTISLLTYVIDGFSALVDKKPTIDAIPVEWLEEQRDKLSEAWDEEWHEINGLIEQWHEEQGAR